MDTEAQPVRGIVGVFDALGAKNFGPEQVSSYIKSQEQILKDVHKKASGQAELRESETPKLFTFSDTIIIALETDVDGEFNAPKGPLSNQRLHSDCSRLRVGGA